MQKHSSGFIQRRLDSISISNSFQELVTTTEILTPISTDHSPVLFSFSKGGDCLRGKRFWKFNSFLTTDQIYITELKNWFAVCYYKWVPFQPSAKIESPKIWSSKIYY